VKASPHAVWLAVALAAAGVVVVALAGLPVGGHAGSGGVTGPGGPERPDVKPVAPPSASASPEPDERPEVPPPPFTEGIFPCSQCHAEMPVDRRRRPLEAMHADIVLRHDEEHRWCLDCHDAEDRDWLHLASGERVSFDESYRLCGQCHGEKLRDWRAGVHGRRKGQWNGHKQYLLCAHCHNPHEPRFKAIEPMPAPRRPARTAP
jgi:hypothetical protein